MAARRAAAALDKGEAVVLCTDGSPQRLQSILARRLNMADEEVSLLKAWQDAEALPAGRLGVMPVSLRAGFHLPNRTIIAVRTSGRQSAADADSLERLSGALRVGDMVVDPERGVARLAGLTMEDQAGALKAAVAVFQLDDRGLDVKTALGAKLSHGVAHRALAVPKKRAVAVSSTVVTAAAALKTPVLIKEKAKPVALAGAADWEAF